MSDIVEHLANAEVVIAVLTELRPNVMYELGVRHTLKRKTIMLVEKDSEIPSDLNAFIALHYSTMTQKGRGELTKTIRERLALLDAG
jgi:predicted nucleotide-binding protein